MVVKTKTCKSKVRQGSKWVTCLTEYTGTFCSNKDLHILPMKTGFCSNGWCEGTKPKDWRGRPVPTCEFYLTCPCKCHDQLNKLYELSEMERMPVDNPEYVPPHRTYWMPSDEPLAPLSSNVERAAAVVVESPAPDLVPATLRRSYEPTATGRAARGQLEAWVKNQCDIWLVEQYDFLCTPAWISEEIAKAEAINPPSVGAIGAVFDRWVKLGFAEVEKKPVRFIKYTEQGIKLGLEGLKLKAKRSLKQQRANQRRGVR